MKERNLGPRTVMAVVKTSFAEIERWQENGIGREEIVEILIERYGIQITLSSFDKSLYRFRKSLENGNVLHNTAGNQNTKILNNTSTQLEGSVLHNTQNQDAEQKEGERESVLHNTHDKENKSTNADGTPKEQMDADWLQKTMNDIDVRKYKKRR